MAKTFKKLACLALATSLTAITCLTYARYIEPSLLFVKKQDIPTNQAISKPLKIVFFSDTHFGVMTSQDNIEKIVNKINSQNPDIVIFGGDFFNLYYKDVDFLDLEYISNWLSKIKATYGKYSVWGNHDYGGGSQEAYSNVMENGGFNLLKNNNIYIELLNVNIIGLDDLLLGESELKKGHIIENSYNLIVSHEPDITEKFDVSNIDLIVGGHSHGGQVFVPYLTKKIIPIGARKHVKGLYENDGSADVFVTSGIGVTKAPYRFMNAPQIVVLTVEREK